MLDTIFLYDATGGGVMTVVAPTSLTIKRDAHIIGYFYDGISAEDIVVTNSLNLKWDPAGFKLPATSAGIATGGGDCWRPLPHKLKVLKGDVLAVTATAGANPVHAGLHLDYDGEPEYSIRPEQEDEGRYVTKGTVAGGTNCAAGTFVQGATNLKGFVQDEILTPLAVKANAAFTTTAFLGLRKLGDGRLFVMPVGLTDVANTMKRQVLPKGLFTVGHGDEIEVFWSSVTAEQPTADVLFVY